MASVEISHLHGEQPPAIAVNALPDRKELSAIAVHRTRMPMVVTDATQRDYPIILANQAFLDLTGYTADEVLGQNCRFLQGLGTSAAAVAEIRAALQDGREVDVELLNYRKDGSAFWNLLHISPIHDDDGRLVYHFGSQIDRTDFHRIESLEASEHRLLLEVNHRANNVLALVESIVRLSRSDDAAQYAASVQKRVQALARAHSLLAERFWDQIPLREVIKTQLTPYGMSRIAVSGPETMLAPLAVQPLALVFHELGINAVSHGALSRPSGKINISWQQVPKDQGLTLEWIERGGPIPAVNRRRGFGTVIADATIQRQLLGTADREWSEGGLKLSIHLPNVVA